MQITPMIVFSVFHFVMPFQYCSYSVMTAHPLVPIIFLFCQTRFCSNLGLPSTVQKAASFIAKKAIELDLVPGYAYFYLLQGLNIWQVY